MWLMCSVRFHTARPSITRLFSFVFSCLYAHVYVSNYCLWFYGSGLCFISTQNLHMNASSSFSHNCLNLEAVVMAFSGCCPVTKSCLTLCDPMDCSTPGFPVLHYLSMFVQTHVHWVGDAIQPSYTLLPLSPLAFNLSQYQGLSQWICSLH